MAKQVNIADAKARLSELVSAAVRGEDIVLARAGTPQVRLVAVKEASDNERLRRAEKRKAAFGMWKDAFEGYDTVVPPSMTEDEIDQHERRFGATDH